MIHRDEGETVEIKREELTQRGGKEREREGWGKKRRKKKKEREKDWIGWVDRLMREENHGMGMR